METFSVPRNSVWFTRSGSEESSQSQNFCVPRSSWKGFRPSSQYQNHLQKSNFSVAFVILGVMEKWLLKSGLKPYTTGIM